MDVSPPPRLRNPRRVRPDDLATVQLRRPLVTPVSSSPSQSAWIHFGVLLRSVVGRRQPYGTSDVDQRAMPGVPPPSEGQGPDGGQARTLPGVRAGRGDPRRWRAGG